MQFSRTLGQATIGLFVAAAIVACGGGGSSSSTPTVTINPTASFTTSTAQLPVGSSVVFSCGCTSQAGSAVVGTGGVIALAATSTAVPATPSPTYTTVPGRNYVVIGTSPTQVQQWTLAFLGNTSATNQYLGSSAAIDNYSTLAALYVYYNSPDALSGNASDVATFDDWNFNTVSSWVAAMRNGTRTSAENQALSDITAAQGSATELYPKLRTGISANQPIARLQAI